MSGELPMVATRAPGLIVAHYEWPHHLLPASQDDLVVAARAASSMGPVGLVFVLAERITQVDPSVRGFWCKAAGDRAFRIATMAIVTRSFAVEVEAMGFAETCRLHGAPVRVLTFDEEHDGVAWTARMLRQARARSAAASA